MNIKIEEYGNLFPPFEELLPDDMGAEILGDREYKDFKRAWAFRLLMMDWFGKGSEEYRIAKEITNALYKVYQWKHKACEKYRELCGLLDRKEKNNERKEGTNGRCESS